ncbi:PREDICTED: uncharacterized protein LOC109156585 [Ipomoea nil]|uniref:uncharacterized protein LOC109156585 n=1 Tax=Ipomoea nil TaxID=35883 RepID=UPI0009018420|nr:PREDICTED: uncharacterized protein LOC109156585 [Ipomoea nil]
MWDVITTGPIIVMMVNTQAAAQGAYAEPMIPKPKSQLNSNEKSRANLDNVARDILYKSLDDSLFPRVRKCKTAMEIWNVLMNLGEGDEQEKDNKLTVAMKKFEDFKMMPSEAITEMELRFTKLMGDLSDLGKELTEKEKNLKILRGIPKSWDMKVTAKRDHRDMKTTSTNKIFSDFKAYEFEHEPKESEEPETRNIALVANQQASTSNRTISKTSNDHQTEDNTKDPHNHQNKKQWTRRCYAITAKSWDTLWRTVRPHPIVSKYQDNSAIKNLSKETSESTKRNDKLESSNSRNERRRRAMVVNETVETIETESSSSSSSSDDESTEEEKGLLCLFSQETNDLCLVAEDDECTERKMREQQLREVLDSFNNSSNLTDRMVNGSKPPGERTRIGYDLSSPSHVVLNKPTNVYSRESFRSAKENSLKGNPRHKNAKWNGPKGNRSNLYHKKGQPTRNDQTRSKPNVNKRQYHSKPTQKDPLRGNPKGERIRHAEKSLRRPLSGNGWSGPSEEDWLVYPEPLSKAQFEKIHRHKQTNYSKQYHNPPDDYFQERYKAKTFAKIFYDYRVFNGYRGLRMSRVNSRFVWIPKLTSNSEGYNVKFSKDKCNVVSTRDGETVLTAKRKKNIYVVSWNLSNANVCLVAKNNGDLSWEWHKKLSHLNLKTINILAKKNLVEGLPKSTYVKDKICEACQKGKQIKTSFKSKDKDINSRPLSLLHMDLFGPVDPASLSGRKYTLVIVDDYPRYAWTLFLKKKNETEVVLLDLLRQLQTKKEVNIIRIRSDQGTEFVNKVIKEFCGQNGIFHQLSAPRTPQQNGVVERRNRTLKEAARTMIAYSGLPKRFWAEAINTACYTQNRSLINKVHNLTPYELWKGALFTTMGKII